MKDIRQITFELTNRCNLKCQICNIWSETPKKDLRLEEIELLASNLKAPFSVSLTGGEAFLHPNIDAIYRYLCKLYLKKIVAHIDISTNGYSPNIIRFLKTHKDLLLPLSVSISIDGWGQKHNQQRNVPDAFERTLDHIAIIKNHNVPIAFKFVITNINYQDLLKVYRFSKKNKIALYVKLYEDLFSYYHRHGKTSRLSLNDQQLQHLKKCVDFMQSRESPRTNPLMYFSLTCLQTYLKTKNLNFIKRCLTPRHSLFVTANGEIYNCLYQESIGNIKILEEIDWGKYGGISSAAKAGDCPKCLSYHGYLREFNYAKNKEVRTSLLK